MVVGWCGSSTGAKSIETLVLSMARRNFRRWLVNVGVGGEGLAEGDRPASVYMCYGGRQEALLGRHSRCPSGNLQCEV
eukprot:9753400-Karenia_brevis.AAC.1